MLPDEGKKNLLDTIIDILDSKGLLEGLSDTDILEITVGFEHLSAQSLSSFSKLSNGSSMWLRMATEIRSLNPNVGKVFLERIGELYPLINEGLSDIWYPMVRDITRNKRGVAVELIENTAEIFSVLPQHQRKLLLLSSKEFMNTDLHLFLTFYSRAPLVLAAISKADFQRWLELGKKLAGRNTEITKLFLKKSPGFISRMDIADLEQYMEMGMELLDEHEAAVTFYDCILRGLGKNLRRHDREQTEHLIDIGVQLTRICWRCVESFFENVPEAFVHLDEEEFEQWVSIGKSIAQSSTFYGSNYFYSCISLLKNLDRKYYSVLFNNANVLIEKNSMLTGIYFSILSDVLLVIHPAEIEKWILTGLYVFETDSESAFSFFRNSPALLRDLDVTELDEWAKNGLLIMGSDISGGRSYFSLRSKSATDFAEKLMSGVALKRVAKVLKYYSVGIGGINFTIRSKGLLPSEFSRYPNPIVSGRTIYLEPTVKGYGDFEENFTIYKLSVMHEVGHIQFGTSYIKPDDSIIERIRLNHPEFINISETGEESFNVASMISKLPSPFFAADILGIIEDARVEYMTTSLYRGLRKEFWKVKENLAHSRPAPVSGTGRFMEGLLFLSAGIEPEFDLSDVTREILDRVNEILLKNVFQPGSSTFDCLEATFDIYALLVDHFDTQELLEYTPIKNFDYRGMGPGSINAGEEFTEDVMETYIPRTMLPDDEKLTQEMVGKGPEYARSKNWKVLGDYSYDEWDARALDYKNDWCSVYEVVPTCTDNEFYLEAMARYAREVTQINRIFKMMKPQSFRRLRRQLDGDDFDLDALIEAFTDRKCGINPTDRLYIRMDKRERDVATLFLLDMSASTKKKLENERRILDVEKDSLIIMTQALESIGDRYAIAAFSGNTRSDVEYYTIKEFDEVFSEETECRISALEPAMNTRLGAAIRHSISKLEAVDAKIKLLVLLSDGRPYDPGLSEGMYEGQIANEDTRIAIQEGRGLGIHFFCITVDSQAGEYLDAIFPDVGYTIIDNAATLPERLPMLYNRITT